MARFVDQFRKRTRKIYSPTLGYYYLLRKVKGVPYA